MISIGISPEKKFITFLFLDNKHLNKAGFSALPLQQVESEDKFERIGGSSIGGGTFWGLGALLTKTKVSKITFTVRAVNR